MADEPINVTPTGDIWTARVVVAGLVALLLSYSAGALLLPIYGKEIPTEGWNLITMIVGILAALLSPLALKK